MAQFRDLIVTSIARIAGKVYASEFIGNLTGKATSATYASTATNAGTSTYSSNSAKATSATSATYASTANYAKAAAGATTASKATSATSATYATTATKAGSANSASTATVDSGGLNINQNYIKNATVSGKVVTFTKGNGSTFSITTQDTDTNTDTKVTQNATTANANYPLLCAPSGTTATTTTTAYFDSGVYLNPNSNTINANISGLAAKATSATSATYASTANYAKASAGATTASKATSATSATYASTSTKAGTATYASSAGSATTATVDGAGNNINETYLKNASVSGKVVTFTKGNGSTFSITTQDTNTNTDTKVTQSRSNASDYRALLMHYTNGAVGTDPGSVTDSVYYNEKIVACPSTGELVATKFTGNLVGTADKATSATSATYASTSSKAGTSTYATNSGTSTYSSNSAKATSATSATYASTATKSGSATKLATARTIAIGTGASGTTTSFDGSANITIPITSVKESYLTWGGKNFSGSFSPIDAAMVPELGANRLAFMPANGVTVEYSTDAGTTWTAYSTTDTEKIKLFNGNGTSYYIGASTATNIDKSKYMLRVTIETNTAKVYTALNKFVIYCNTNGSTGTYCTITARTQANYAAGTDTWATFANKVEISGWSGYNVINTSNITTYGNNDAHYRQVRFTFGVTSHTSANYAGLIINKIFGFGGMGWTTPSTMAKTGLIYSYDASKNVTFPANVTANTFIGSLTGNATSATKASTATYATSAGSASKATSATSATYATTASKAGTATVDSGGLNINQNYIKGLSVSGKVITYTKGNGTTGSITTQDTNTTYSNYKGATTAASGTAGLVPAATTATRTSFLRGDGTWAVPSNTTYSNATTATAGLLSANDKSKLDAITASADAVSFSRSLTSGTKVGTITINGTGTDLYAPTNTDTHYTTGLKIGASSTATANAAATNGNVYLNVLDNTTIRDSHKITGSGSVTVTSDANGVITIKGTDNNTTYANYKGATTAASGTAGLVPAATTATRTGFLRGDGVWTTPSNASSATYATNSGTATYSTSSGSSSKATSATSATYATTATSAGKASTATVDSAGNNINTTYLKNASVSGKVITFTKGNGSTFSITTQDIDTDTKNTAGSTNSSSKLFLIGATSQAANPQTYSHDTAYVGTDGCLYSGGTRVDTEIVSATEPTTQTVGDYWVIESSL